MGSLLSLLGMSLSYDGGTAPLMLSKYTRANLVAYCSFCRVYWLHLNLIANVNFGVWPKVRLGFLQRFRAIQCLGMSAK